MFTMLKKLFGFIPYSPPASKVGLKYDTMPTSNPTFLKIEPIQPAPPALSRWEIMESQRSHLMHDLLVTAKNKGWNWKEGPILQNPKRKAITLPLYGNEIYGAFAEELRKRYLQGNTIFIYTPAHAKYYEVQFYKSAK